MSTRSHKPQRKRSPAGCSISRCAYSRRRRPARSTIILQGMQGDKLHLIKAGEVRVLWREGPGCPSYELATLCQGELIGVFGEDDWASASEFTLQTVRPCELYSVSRHEFIARFKPAALKSTRDSLRAKSDTWRQRARAKQLTEPKGAPLGSLPMVGNNVPPLEPRVSARNMARTRRYSVGPPYNKRLLDDDMQRPCSTARPAVPASPAGVVPNPSISSGPLGVSDLVNSPRTPRAQRRVSSPHTMPRSWLRVHVRGEAYS